MSLTTQLSLFQEGSYLIITLTHIKKEHYTVVSTKYYMHDLHIENAILRLICIEIILITFISKHVLRRKSQYGRTLIRKERANVFLRSPKGAQWVKFHHTKQIHNRLINLRARKKKIKI